MLVVELRSHSNTKTIQWGRQQLLILVVDSETQPYFLHLFFSKHIWPYWKRLYKIYYVMPWTQKNLGHQHIIKNRFSFEVMGAGPNTFPFWISIDVINWKTKVCAPISLTLSFLLIYSWSVVRFMNLNCFQFSIHFWT